MSLFILLEESCHMLPVVGIVTVTVELKGRGNEELSWHDIYLHFP